MQCCQKFQRASSDVRVRSRSLSTLTSGGRHKRGEPGQPVELTSDLYGEDVVFHGKVAGFSGGTGAAFALVPAQNATGNWIKVVQRLPVRVTLDPEELKKHPLRVGLSMEVDVDVSN